ncbi:hypothetical protein ACVILE_004166 [Streptomyces sp. M18.1]
MEPWRSIISKKTVGAVLDRLGEDLQQVAVLVAVDEDLQLAQRLDGDAGLAGPLAEGVVVRVGRVQELDAVRLHRAHGLHDVVGVQRDVLDAGAAVELQVLVDLGLLLGDGGLVDRELHLEGAVGHDLRHQRAVLGGDVVAHELLHVREAHDLVVEADPLVHPAQFDVADAVVHGLEGAVGGGLDDGGGGDVAGQVGAVVAGALDQGVAGLAVGGDGGEDDGAVLVLDLVRLRDGAGAVLDGVGVGGARVRDLDGEVDDAVAVLGHVPGEELAPLGGRLDHRGEDEAGGAVLQDVAGGLAAAVLRSGVGDQLHAEGGGVVVRCLLGVAHGEDDRVHSLDREGVGLPGGVGSVVCGLRHSRRVSRVCKVRNSLRVHWATCPVIRRSWQAICTG